MRLSKKLINKFAAKQTQDTSKQDVLNAMSEYLYYKRYDRFNSQTKTALIRAIHEPGIGICDITPDYLSLHDKDRTYYIQCLLCNFYILNLFQDFIEADIQLVVSVADMLIKLVLVIDLSDYFEDVNYLGTKLIMLIHEGFAVPELTKIAKKLNRIQGTPEAQEALAAVNLVLSTTNNR